MIQPSSSAPTPAPTAGADPVGATDRGMPVDTAGAASVSVVDEGAGVAMRSSFRCRPLRRIGRALKRGSSSDASWSSVGTTAVAKIAVMGISGVFGLVNTSLIIRYFGADAFAQYGLLATFPTLMPFTDLGIGAVILNTVASSTDPAHDSTV